MHLGIALKKKKKKKPFHGGVKPAVAKGNK